MNTHKPLTTTGVRTTGIRGDGPSHRARHVAWMRERRWIAVGLAVAVVALAADMLLAGIGQLLGYTYTAAPDHDMLYWLCMFTMAVSAMASWSMFRFLICQGVSRRTIVTTQFAGNACIAAVVGVALTIVAAVDVLLIHLPAWQIFVGRAGMIARYPYALSWVPRYLSDEFGRTAVRMPGINWLILILAVFAFLMMAAMIGQFLGELAACLGVRGVLMALVAVFVAALLYGRVVPLSAKDAVARLLAFMMGVYQRGSGMEQESAYSLWPLLGSMIVITVLCGAASWLFVRRRESHLGTEPVA